VVLERPAWVTCWESGVGKFECRGASGFDAVRNCHTTRGWRASRCWYCVERRKEIRESKLEGDANSRLRTARASNTVTVTLDAFALTI